MTQPERFGLPRELFISHADVDGEFVDRLARELTRHGVPHWLSRREIRGSQQWHDEIGEALGRCDWFAVLLSPASVGSLWVKRELLYALTERRYVDRIVPVLLDDCDIGQLSWTLGSIQRIDFRDGWARGMTELLRVWGLAYQS